MSKKIVILGLGNILLKDEGVGVRVAGELSKRGLPENVDIIDGGTASLDVLTSIKDIEKLIIIDALKGGEEPGSIYRLCPEDLLAETKNCVSLHQINLLDALNIAKKIGSTPEETVIIGIEPKAVDSGLGVTSCIEQKIPEIINIVLKELENDCHRKKTNK